jgi:hypothetical protein
MTFDQETWFMPATQLLTVVNISMKFHQNLSMRVGDNYDLEKSGRRQPEHQGRSYSTPVI